jgi:ABC-type multidrug transport system ATPase subunit
MLMLGLHGCKDTVVGDQALKGISGGQKRRVTMGEMVVCPRPVKFMDGISNGLDSATAFDIIRSCKIVTTVMGVTMVVSLLQVHYTVLASIKYSAYLNSFNETLKMSFF